MKKRIIIINSLILLVALLFGGIYNYFLYVWGLSFAITGHGSDLPFHLVAEPLGIGLLLWPVIFVATAFARYRFCRFIARTFLIVHYISIAMFLEMWENGNFPSTSPLHGGNDYSRFFYVVLIHCAVNAILLIRLFLARDIIKGKRRPTSSLA